MILFLALGAWCLLFTACERAVSDAEQVKEIVQSLREKPLEWEVTVIDDAKATRFEHVNGLTMLRSNLTDAGFKRHSHTLNLEPGGITLLPTPKELVGEALQAVLLASEDLANAALAQAEAAKKEASVIKLE